MHERDIKAEREEERGKIAEIRESLVREIGQEAYDKSGHKEIHDQAEGAIDAEEQND